MKTYNDAFPVSERYCTMNCLAADLKKHTRKNLDDSKNILLWISAKAICRQNYAHRNKNDLSIFSKLKVSFETTLAERYYLCFLSATLWTINIISFKKFYFSNPRNPLNQNRSAKLISPAILELKHFLCSHVYNLDKILLNKRILA